MSLIVEPPAVRRGQYATLYCMYDLDGMALYSVKFYRGYREFYRYSPSEYPTSKVFLFDGITVDVSLFITFFIPEPCFSLVSEYVNCECKYFPIDSAIFLRSRITCSEFDFSPVFGSFFFFERQRLCSFYFCLEIVCIHSSFTLAYIPSIYFGEIFVLGVLLPRIAVQLVGSRS